MTDDSFPTMYCINHPQRETMLRCNRCEQPICIQCAVLTPTGYRCKNCVRGQQKVFETAQSADPILAFGVAAVLAFGGSYVARVMLFFTIFLAPIIGMVIVEAVRYITRRRRSPMLFRMAAAGAALGSLPLLGILAVEFLTRLGGGAALMGSRPELLLWQAVYAVLVTLTVYNRLSGIQA
jgi:hypothetical protein